MDGVQYLWQDKKRYLGMPISFTRYALSEDRLFTSIGWLNIRDEQMVLYRVRDINVSRTLGQRFFGVGSVTLLSSDKSTPNLTLVNIQHPMEVKELIHRQVEESKKKNKGLISEIVGGPMGEEAT
jgi:membrane protein YdbS with pleckstrin-like domain